MKNSKDQYHCAGLLAAVIVFALLPQPAPSQTASSKEAIDTIWTVPNVGALPDDSDGRLVRRGRDLVTATYSYIGPEVSNRSKRYAGNNLACGNCHLEAGTKRFGLPVFGLYDAFPRYSARAGGTITIEERVNSCMTRSMNGRSIPNDAPEMAAFIAYIKFLSSGVPRDQRIPGLGAGKIPELDRAADPTRGYVIYLAQCAGCHNTDGSGIRRNQHAARRGLPEPCAFDG
jgi:thiosulfate dehydrogenase